MDVGKRLIVVVIALLLVGDIAFLSSRNKEQPRATSLIPHGPFPGCLELPKRRATPSWYPRTLPMPAGSYATSLPLSGYRGYRQLIFAARGTLQDFVRHALTVWPQTGWRLGRGEAEPGEAEDRFYNPQTRVIGAFRARSVFCDQGWTWVYVIFGKVRAPGPTPTASTSPLQPSP